MLVSTICYNNKMKIGSNLHMEFKNKPQKTSMLVVPLDSELNLHTENGQVVVSSRVVAEELNMFIQESLYGK